MHAACELLDPSLHLDSIWRSLSDAVNSSDSPFRTPMLVTVAANGSPQARAVALRSVERAVSAFRIYTDARSPKVDEIAREPRTGLTFWDPVSRVQLRATGMCVRLDDERSVREAWEHVPGANRVNYRTTQPPGSAIDSPVAEKLETDRIENFALLAFVATAFDWLWLDSAGHKRCSFDLVSGARQWLVP